MEILILLVLVLLNGIFSMSEIALVSARKTRLDSLATQGNRKAKAALELAKSPNTFLSTVQIGITAIGLITGIYSGENITDDFESVLIQFHWIRPYSHQAALITVVFIVTFASLVLGELVPKRLGMSNPEAVAMAVARPMQVISSICKPFIWLLTSSTEIILRFFGAQNATQQHMTEEEIKSIIQESVLTGELKEIEQDIVERAFGLGDLRVSSLMTHRSDLAAIHIDKPVEQIRRIVEQDLHSFYPVFKGSEYETLGVIALKDLFKLPLPWSRDALLGILRKPHYFPEYLTVYNALEKFKADRLHYGLVLDEYGGLQGMVTINDILEALVGEINELDEEEYRIVEVAQNEWLADGAFPFFEFINYFDIDGPIEKDLPFNTLAGLVLEELERFPQKGESVTWHGFKLEVVAMGSMRIEKIKIVRLAE
ncbi:MAG: hemolysin [Sphingobacteriaceae bacterium]|nr:hemolysin [Sphingobacteriaceae bacterium]